VSGGGNESSIVGAFLNRFASNFAHRIKIENRVLDIEQLSRYVYMKATADGPAKVCQDPVFLPVEVF